MLVLSPPLSLPPLHPSTAVLTDLEYTKYEILLPTGWVQSINCNLFMMCGCPCTTLHRPSNHGSLHRWMLEGWLNSAVNVSSSPSRPLHSLHQYQTNLWRLASDGGSAPGRTTERQFPCTQWSVNSSTQTNSESSGVAGQAGEHVCGEHGKGEGCWVNSRRGQRVPRATRTCSPIYQLLFATPPP